MSKVNAQISLLFQCAIIGKIPRIPLDYAVFR